MRKPLIILVLLAILGSCVFFCMQRYVYALNNASHFLVYKSACCTPPTLNSEAGEGFIVNGQASQPFAIEQIAEITRLGSIQRVIPFLTFTLLQDEHLVTICGQENTIESKTDFPIIVHEKYAAAQQLVCGEKIMLKSRACSIVEIRQDLKLPVQADILMPLADAQSLLNLEIMSEGQALVNVAWVQINDVRNLHHAITDVQNILGASTQIIISKAEKTCAACQQPVCTNTAGKSSSSVQVF